MAFENGYNVFNYCNVEFRKYRNDRNIFLKALQSLQFFTTRSDYPYCLNEMDSALQKIIGVGVSDLALFKKKYILEFDERLFWDATDVEACEPFIDGELGINLIADLDKESGDELVNNFKSEYQSFLETIELLLDDIFFAESGALGLAKVVKKPTYGDTSLLRFIRSDNEYLDLCMNNREIDKLCDSLLKLKDNK